MRSYEFTSSVVSNEINLNEISKHFGINKKFKWEEPLVLNEELLKGIIPQPKGKFVYIFYFGSIVFVNITYHEANDILTYIKRIDRSVRNASEGSYVEDFKLIEDENSKFEINYNSIVVPELQIYNIDIISTVLAKSVALRKIEKDIDKLLDEIEGIIVFLDKGHLNLSDEKLAITSGKVLRFKYNTISYIMLLDKPDIAWKNEEAEEFFTNLSNLFELNDRYEKVHHKSEVLLDITEVFSGLAHSKRGTRLEWAVIILILIELALSILDKLIK